MIGSVYRKDLSVMTPSIAHQSLTQAGGVSSESGSFHISNPNPQRGHRKYLGIRDLGYASMHQSPAASTHSSSFSLIGGTPNFKFGKKVFLDNKLSNKEVLEDHLKQMRNKADLKKFQRDSKLKEDKDFLRFVQA